MLSVINTPSLQNHDVIFLQKLLEFRQISDSISRARLHASHSSLKMQRDVVRQMEDSNLELSVHALKKEEPLMKENSAAIQILSLVEVLV